MPPIRSLSYLCAFWLFLGQAVAAQWLYEKKPELKGSSMEVAAYIPGDAQLVLGFALKGQLDVLEMANDLQEVIGNDSFLGEAEHALGQPVASWLKLFSGRGFVAALQPASDEEWRQSAAIALELEDPEAFDRWLTPLLGEQAKERRAGEFRIREGRNGTRFGLGQTWFFFTWSDAVADRLAASLVGEDPVLASSTMFKKARKSLTGGASGAFTYVDGNYVRQALYSSMDLDASDPNLDHFAFWEFAVLSVDFAGEQAEGFFGIDPDAGDWVQSLRQPGRVGAGLLDLVPGGQSTLMAVDAKYLTNAVASLADENPYLGLVVGMARSYLRSMGDLDQTFAGTMAMGSNSPEVFSDWARVALFYEREEAQLVHCKGNLGNLATALEMYSTDWAGSYPDSLDKLTPEYLREIPLCPTEQAGPYRYSLVQEEGYDFPVFQLVCTGKQHPQLAANHPRYGVVGLIEGERIVATDSQKPERDPELSSPTVSVVLPVTDVAEAHRLMAHLAEMKRVRPYQGCGENLRSIGLAAETHASELGAYPESLAQLVQASYLTEIPFCPSAKEDTYSTSYRRLGDDNDSVSGVSVFCQGHHHPELEADKPYYESTLGLDLGKVEEVAVERPTPPGKGESRAYEVQDGPRAVLDAGASVLRLGYGPRAQVLAESGGSRWSEIPVIAEGLRWGDSRLVYLDYLDLEPSYSTFLAALDQAAAGGEKESIQCRELLRRWRPRVGALRGASYLKVRDQGLHYRSQGAAATSHFLLAGAVEFALAFSSMGESQAASLAAGCKANLRNIGTGLEMWAVENGGHYPDSLEQIVGDHLEAIPACPAAETDTYSATYRKYKRLETDEYENYEVYCQGHHHEDVGLAEDYPRYDGYHGLLESAP